ncbi:MAG: tRNA (adenosine(37)-N6)-threonylcarbamoyltransferase complex dimerization subunit type 1 TsaB [Parvibaculaceae bacterium]
MLTLALDTSLAACSAALHDSASGAVLARQWMAMERGHGEALPQMVAAVMAESGHAFSDIGRIAAPRGPGSFTGIRIGLAMARGLALALGKPIVAPTTLEALAWNIVDNPEARPIVAVIDPGREEFHLQTFDPRGVAVSDASAVRHKDLMAFLPRDALVTGPGTELLVSLASGLAPIASRALALPDAGIIAVRAAALPPTRSPEPLYLRPPDAKPLAMPVAAPA